MRVLRRGMNGEDVGRWQQFLRGKGYEVIVDDDFGAKTEAATIQYQKDNNLLADGVAGNKTFATAMLTGFGVLADDDPDKTGPNWPPLPDFKPLSLAERKATFGDFQYVAAPTTVNPEGIKILGDWAKNNIVQVTIPQLEKVDYKPTKNSVSWNKNGVDQLVQVFKDWEDAGLLDRILTWGGSWSPRFIRGSRTSLSNHAWATAFDINVPWNGLGVEPARVGKKGSVRELVEIAHWNGFYWGGHFSGRPDGMHFELAKI